MSTYNLQYLSEKNRGVTIKESSNDYYSLRSLSVLKHNSAVIASKSSGGPGVFFNGNYIKESDLHIGCSEIQGVPDNADISFVQEEVVFIGTFLGVWGHCLTDNLKHLWFLDDERHGSLKKLKFVYTMLNDADSMSLGMKKLLSKLGVHEEQLLQIKGAVSFSKVYIPEQCFFCIPGGVYYRSGYRYYTKEYRQIIDRILANTEMVSGPEKVYFTRTNWIKEANQRYRDYGEDNIEQVFRNLGYEIIAPEKLSVDEQISIVHNCKSFASTQGSVSLNAVFCKKGTEVCIINKQNYNAPYQLAVNHFIDSNITIIDANRSSMNSRLTPWGGPFFMYQSKELCAWSNQHYHGFPVFGYVIYVLYAIGKKMKGKVRRIARKLLRELRNL